MSIVIPAYNAEGFISRAIHSVLSQTHADLEVIVVDDGSTDGTFEVASVIPDSRVSAITGPNRGPSAARNVGLAKASGVYLAFLDADDYWMEEKLEHQLPLLESRHECIAVGCLMRYESIDGRELGIAGEMVGPGDQSQIAGARLMPFTLSSILFRGEALREVGGFDESLQVSADFDLVVRLAGKGQVCGVPAILGAYLIHDASISARRFALQRKTARFIRARLAAADVGESLTWEDFERTYSRSLRQRHGDRVQEWYRAAGQSVAIGRWLRAIRYGLLALLVGPRYTISRVYRQRVRKHRA